MLRVQADVPLPSPLRRGAWVPLEVSVRDESNGRGAWPATARLQLGVTLALAPPPAATPTTTAAAALLHVRPRPSSSSSPSSPPTTSGRTPLWLDARGRFVGELCLVASCTRAHYQGGAHTPACLHRIRQPVYVHLAVVAATGWPGHTPASFLPVTLGPLVVAHGDAPPVEGAAGAPTPLPPLQRRVHVLARPGAGPVTTLERPTAVQEGFGHVVWDAALVLVRWLEAAPPALLAGRRVVEVGSGVGLAGIAAAALGAHVTLTDLPTVLPLTRANAAANADVVQRARGSLDVQPLPWGDAAAASVVLASIQVPGGGRSGGVTRALHPPDVVLASDVVYQDVLVAPLVATLAALAGPATVVLVAARERHGCDWPGFLTTLAGPFDVSIAPLTGAVAVLADACVLSKARRTPQVYRLVRRAA
jgi:predicted nicotinamide N-methyase